MDPGVTIVLLGHTGVGKSASGNTILGTTAFVSKLSFGSVTKEISEKKGKVCGMQVSLIDTPGILCPGAEQQIETCCQALLRGSRPCLFLVVVKLGRFTEEERRAVNAVKGMLGEEGLRHTYVLFTHGDALHDKELEDFIYEDPESVLPSMLEGFGNRYHLLNNKNGEGGQVQQLLKKWRRQGSHLQGTKPAHNQNQMSSRPAELRPTSSLHQSSSVARQKKTLGLPPPASANNSNKTKIKTQLTSACAFPSPGRTSVTLEDRRIVLLGLPGAGKSSTGNTILGSSSPFSTGSNADPITRKSMSASAQVEGRRVTVVDTPGFSGGCLSPEQLLTEIMASSTLVSPGPHVFVFVVRIGRTSQVDQSLLKNLLQMFGSDFPNYTMVLFTHGDELAGGTIEDWLKANTSMSKLVTICGGRYCVFNNRDGKNRLQVRNLLGRIDEMVEAHGGQHFTSEMYRPPKSFFSRVWEKLVEWFEALLNLLNQLASGCVSLVKTIIKYANVL